MRTFFAILNPTTDHGIPPEKRQSFRHTVCNHTNILKPALVASNPLTSSAPYLPASDLQSAPVDAHRPLVIVDVDEVLALFMEGFQRFVEHHGYEMRLTKFALFQNIFRKGEDNHIDMLVGKVLFDDFFRDGSDHMDAAPGAAEALAALSARANVVILTNAPEHGRIERARWLKRQGMDYPLVINSGLKGPAAAHLAARTSRPSAFIDDMLPNLASVAADAPHIHRFQMVADERLRPLAPTNPDQHRRIDEWLKLQTALETALF